jgi:hypothetical protein
MYLCPPPVEDSRRITSHLMRSKSSLSSSVCSLVLPPSVDISVRIELSTMIPLLSRLTCYPRGRSLCVCAHSSPHSPANSQRLLVTSHLHPHLPTTPSATMLTYQPRLPLHSVALSTRISPCCVVRFAVQMAGEPEPDHFEPN